MRRYQAKVRATLRRLTAGNHALADDLAQETFLLAYRNLRSFRQEAQFSTWLYRIATNAFLAHARKRKEELLGDADAELAEEDDAGGADATETAGDHARSASLRLDMERAMAVLSEAERAAIVHCYHLDLSHEEAAQALGCPVGTVKTHILRAKQKLKTALAAWGDDADWLDTLLRADGLEAAGEPADGDAFTASVMAALPAPAAAAVPAWRKPALTGLWAVAGLGLAASLPSAVTDVAHDVLRFLATHPVTLMELVGAAVVFGAATWTGAAYALRRD